MRKRIRCVRVAESTPHGVGVNLRWPELNAALAEAEEAVRREKTTMGRYARYLAMGELCYASGTACRAVHYWTQAMEECFAADYETLSKEHKEKAEDVADRIDAVRRKHGMFRYRLSARREVFWAYYDICRLRWGE